MADMNQSIPDDRNKQPYETSKVSSNDSIPADRNKQPKLPEPKQSDKPPEPKESDKPTKLPEPKQPDKPPEPKESDKLPEPKQPDKPPEPKESDKPPKLPEPKQPDKPPKLPDQTLLRKWHETVKKMAEQRWKLPFEYKAQNENASRFMLKSGKVNAITYSIVAWNPFTFNNVVRLNWFNIIHVYLALLIITWNFFAIVYHVMEANNTCINDVSSYVGAVLYSIETQQTIGYGKRYAHPEGCWYVTIMVIWQTITGILLTTIATGIVMTKFSRPKDRVKEIKFSKIGVVTQRNGESCLLIRIADKGENRLVGAEVDAILYKHVTTEEGEYIQLQPHKVHFGYDLLGGCSDIPLLWPLCISHKIDENSPFYDIKRPFELVVWLSGTDEETGLLAQARTSFTTDEIKWKTRFCTKLYKKGTEVVVFYDDEAMDMITNDNTPKKFI